MFDVTIKLARHYIEQSIKLTFLKYYFEMNDYSNLCLTLQNLGKVYKPICCINFCHNWFLD